MLTDKKNHIERDRTGAHRLLVAAQFLELVTDIKHDFMLTNKKTMLLLVAILVVAAWLLRNEDSSTAGDLPNEPIINETDIATGPEDTLGGVVNNDRTSDTEETTTPEAARSDSEYVHLLAELNRSRSAIEEDRVISRAESADLPVAKDWRLNLDVMCHPEQIDFLAVDDSPDGFAARYRDYCDGYSPTIDLSADKFSGYMSVSSQLHRAEELNRLRKREFSTDLDERTRQINQILKGARFEEDVSAVSYYLTQMLQEKGILLWNPVSEVPPVQLSRLVELQGFSLELYSCWRFGRCGPLAPRTIMNCAVVGICESWWGYADFLAASLPPFEFEYVQNVARSIGSSR